MEEIILKILNNGEINLLQVVFLLIVLLIILVKQRKTNEKIDLIGNNHLHTVDETLQRIENKLENGFQSIENKLSDVQKSVEIIKDRQNRNK